MSDDLLRAFAIGSRFGDSGFGELWHGERRHDARAVTLQLLPVAETSFAATSVVHANLARALDCGVTAAGRPYVALASLEGAAPLRGAAALSGAQVANVAFQIANALEALHHAGVLHGGLSTASLFAVGDHVMVLDAGLAGAHGDPRSDIYALGCVAFELATGHAHDAATTPPVTQLAGAVSPTLGKLIARMMDKDPAQRPREAHELARVLTMLASGETAPALGTTIGAHAMKTIVANLGATVHAHVSAPNLGPTLRPVVPLGPVDVTLGPNGKPREK